ncbi:MAG: phosphoribosylformylglycinamidine synthase subunit PurQ, partial [Candidatus Omnitrophota bacterium]|nr:phosphoribosylformylglycinamidine synthase subunit PurQ [Candidatus Omnitrophota bacterium]
FQVLVKSGILPGVEEGSIEATLSFNDSGRFEDRWTYLRASRCVWTKNMPKTVYLPIAHGEGKFIPRDEEVLKVLKKNKQIVFQYVDEKGRFGKFPVNPNGSVEHIAGISDATGRVLGMMPHPERHILGTQHPRWTRDGLK